ncbi:MAG: glycoside hydrolase family 38 C-terminal domain-containing protein, partial [Candidatus Cloacimonadaceae bacterium]|nr:glycoside hydrolase family 38 C-terminal domain-containing protein [Candidatus Cloacimonadaceae bacterium]
SSSIRQSIELVEDEPFIRVRHEVDWKQKHQMLRVHFHPDVDSDTATYEIQFGVIKRSAKPCNAWDLARFEVPAHRFADLSRPDFGCALLSRDKYGYRVVGNEMDLNLLRSPADVDPNADIHAHDYYYAFYPHGGDYEHSEVLPMAHKFSSDMHIARVGALPQMLEGSLFQIDSDSVKLETVKPSENGEGIVLRLYEYKGAGTKARLQSNIAFGEAWLTTMLEERLEKLESDGGGIDLSFHPFEVKTILLRKL